MCFFCHHLEPDEAFERDDDSDSTLPNRTTFNNLAPGTHIVTEVVPTGWWLDSLACVDPDGGSTTDLVAAEATIDLDLGESITCSFTNTDVPEPRMSLLGTAALLALAALSRHRQQVR